MKPKLFGSSGIRGLVNQDITVELAQRLGATLSTINNEGKIVVGYDARLSGPMLELSLVAGVNSAGGEVYRVGLVPTPVTAWMIGKTGSDAGVELTASHNPPPYNGLKVFNRDGMSLTIEGQLQVEALLIDGGIRYARWDSVGKSEEKNGIDPYVKMLSDSINITSKIKVSADCLCGATSTLAPKAFSAFPVHAEILNATPNGRFPAGSPEPNKSTLQRLGEHVRASKSALGFGFDGDGDRMMAVDSKGNLVNPDKSLAAYAGYVVKRKQGGTIVTHVGASMNVDEVVKEAGGKVVRTPVGDAFITEAMAKENALFGGEPVGAWVFPEHHMCPAGVLGALKILEALEETGQTIEEFISHVPEFPLDRVKIECPNHQKQNVMSKLSEGYIDSFKKVKSVSTVDGLRLEMEYGWILMRPSGTEPLIRLTVEGRTGKDVQDIMHQGKELVKKALKD